MRVLVLGGTGVISRAIVAELLSVGHEVVVYNRGNRNFPWREQVRVLTGDRHNRQGFQETMAAHAHDVEVVIDMISYTEEDAQSTLAAFAGRVEQFIFCSTVSAYKRPIQTLPITESAVMLEDRPQFAYGFHKSEMERYLFGLTRETSPAITVIRPSLTYGEGSANIGVLRQNYGIVDRIMKDKPLVMFGDGTIPWNFTFAPDLAKAFVGAVGNRNTFWQAYHATNEDFHVWNDLYTEFGHLIGKEPQIVHVPTEFLHRASPALFGHVYDEKMYAGLFDSSKIKHDVPAFRPEISLRQGLETILQWYEREPQTVDATKDLIEDQIVQLHQSMASQFTKLLDS